MRKKIIRTRQSNGKWIAVKMNPVATEYLTSLPIGTYINIQFPTSGKLRTYQIVEAYPED